MADGVVDTGTLPASPSVTTKQILAQPLAARADQPPPAQDDFHLETFVGDDETVGGSRNPNGWRED
jgi:hypothetical protein